MTALAPFVLLAAAGLATVPDTVSVDPRSPLEVVISRAEASLRQGERQIAESQYREALEEGWLLQGSLDAVEGRWAEAKAAFERASTATADPTRSLRTLALVHLRLGEAEAAAQVLGRVVARHRGDFVARCLLAEALIAAGRPEEAVRELETARATAPRDPEVAFALATGYLHVKRPEAAAALFADVARQRPIAQTYVLMGRTYRDAGEYERARAALRQALRLDPQVRRARYYLGTVELFQHGPNKVEEAIALFQQELRLAPRDPLVNLYLGAAHVDARKYAEALPALEIALSADPPSPAALHYYGRCLLGLERPQEAVPPLERALALAEAAGAKEQELGTMHHQLAMALRGAGRTEEAAPHFAAAQQILAQQAHSLRERLARYLADIPDPQTAPGSSASALDLRPWQAMAPADRDQLRGRVRTALARTYFNLGVMQVQAGKPAHAADFLEQAAEVDPEFPKVQYSLGLALFNGGRFAQATGPLSRALERTPADTEARRLLALSWLNVEDFGKAVELLERDPDRERNPSLQYAYGLALVRSGRADLAQPVFARLLSRFGDTAEVNVLLGQAHAQQGDFESAVQVLKHALELKADVPEANAALGVIQLKQGRLPEAEAALRAELKVRPADQASRYNLATVLEMTGQTLEAETVLRSLLAAQPDHAEARYLLGKILLARGQAADAAPHLEAAVRLAPEDPKAYYLLGQAYQKLGRAAESQEQFDRFRQLKDKRRGESP